MNPVLLSLFAVDLIGTMSGIHVMQSAHLSRKISAVSSGVMLGVGLFWILPDITRSAGAAHSFLSVAVCVAAIYAVDHFIHPVCPCRSRYGHSHCERPAQALLPLVIAIAVHNLFDGWTAGIAAHGGNMLRSGITAGLIASKIPEGLVFGMMLRSASRNRSALLWSAFFTGSCILAGAAMHDGLTLLPSSIVLTLSMAIACASFVFIGLHTFQQQREESGAKPALLSLAAGIAGTVIVEQGLSLVLR
jgi:zinc transporter ZupT